MADIEEVNYPSGGRRADSPVDIESRNEREGSRESDHDDRDRRRRGGGYERDLRRENRRYAPYPSQDERSGRRQSGSSGKECRVYVWNLPYNVKWQDLKDFMKTGIVVLKSVLIWRTPDRINASLHYYQTKYAAHVFCLLQLNSHLQFN